jgi:DNA-binding transcriptional MerR regulator
MAIEQNQNDTVTKDAAYFNEVRAAVGRGAPSVLFGTSSRALERAVIRLSEASGSSVTGPIGRRRFHFVGGRRVPRRTKVQRANSAGEEERPTLPSHTYSPKVGERQESAYDPSDQESAYDPSNKYDPQAGGYGGAAASGVAGITYRQLDSWVRSGLVEPSIEHETRRLYGFRDILVLKAIKRLLDSGVSLQQIRTVVGYLRSRADADLKQVTLLSDGHGVYEAVSPDEVTDLLQEGQGVFGIALGRLWSETESALESLQVDKARPKDKKTPPVDELATRRARRIA